MVEWHEFRLWWDINPNQDNVFAFKKTYVIPILEKYGIEDFLMLDERDFVLLRINIDSESSKRVHSDLEEIIKIEPIFSKVTVGSWSPVTDAKDRILAAREQVKIPVEIPEGGWMIKGKTSDGEWAVAPEDLNKQVAAFSIFMSKVVGKFTKAYLKEIPYRVEDRWLVSVFLHLLLDSVSTWQPEEKEIREFPYV